MHVRCDGQGRPLGFVLTSGEVSDYKAVPTLLDMRVTKPKALLADKGYDSDRVRGSLLWRGILPIIHPGQTAERQQFGTSDAILIATKSSACSTGLSNPAASLPVRQSRLILPRLSIPRCSQAMVTRLCQQGPGRPG
ncbi:transposase [Novosphingobium sp. RD2P27]|uniref:Transposase n=1 Tax=Novosphingobium kalidii TaxID=3230299 RepID=A0ABV2CWN8_9SPHN